MIKGSNAVNLLHELTTNSKYICGIFVNDIRGVDILTASC